MNVQHVRLLDVFVIAPILIYAGIKTGLKTPLGIVLIVIGIGTLYYNAVNYMDESNVKL